MGNSSSQVLEPYRAYGDIYRTRAQMVQFLNNNQSDIKEYDELYRLYMQTLENPPEDVEKYKALFNKIKNRPARAAGRKIKRRRKTRKN